MEILGLAKLVAALKDVHHNKYTSYRKLFSNLCENRKSTYSTESISRLRERKKSDTIFILCSGPSILDITPENWEHINHHDSIGINFSYLLPHTPTYHIFSWEKNFLARKELVKNFSIAKERYQNTIIMVSTKALYRFAHPLTTPDFFPVSPTCCFYKTPKSIQLDCSRPFSDADFDKTIFYRNTSSHALELAVNYLEYKKVVLLGVDLQTSDHFFYGMPNMKIVEQLLKNNFKETDGKLRSMFPSGNKYHPFDVYLFSLRNYLEREKKVRLFIQDSQNILSTSIPSYF